MSNQNYGIFGYEPLIAYAYVPIQYAEDTNLYDAQTGLERGTIFPPLDLPLGVYGKQVRTKEAVDND